MPRMRREAPTLYVTLVHFPVYNKGHEVVATSLTTLNLHDLARLAVTYGVAGVFISTPLARQRELAQDLINHWTRGYGAVYNPTRAEALQCLHVVDTLEMVEHEIISRHGVRPRSIATDARRFPQGISYAVLRRELWESGAVFLLLLGTGWGLTENLIADCDYILEPIYGVTSYNHLPVRIAAGIMLDRLLGCSDAPVSLPTHVDS
jgi:hypothetical protein